MIREAIAGCIVAAALPALSSILHGQNAAHKKPDVHVVVTRQPAKRSCSSNGTRW